MVKWTLAALIIFLLGCHSPNPALVPKEAPPPGGKVTFFPGAVRIEDGQGVRYRMWEGGKIEQSDSLSMAEPELSEVFEIPGRPEDQRVLNAMVHNLVVGYQEGPLSPFGLSNDRFNYHVFWDADCWVFPALMLIEPRVAARIPTYRLDRAEAAKENFRRWQAGGYPVANRQSHQPLPGLVRLTNVQPAMFPWESGEDGLESSPSDTIHEHHITGDVAWMLDLAANLSLVPRDSAQKVIGACAAFYLYRLASNPDGTYGIRNVLSPDEWHTVDNDYYTNAVAEHTIRLANPGLLQGITISRPADEQGPLNFDNDTYRQYQQHAAMLAIWPLADPRAIEDAARIYERFRGSTAPEGPAMSRSLESLVAARLGKSEEAYKLWQESWRNYSRDPATEFREKPKGESYFLTGAAGCVNAVIYGFLGAEVRPTEQGSCIRLPSGKFLSFRPNLPREWPELKLRIRLQGGPSITVIARGKSVQLVGE